MRLLVMRPEDDARSLAAALATMRHEAVVAPLMTIRLLHDASLPDERWQAILLTSANGARALGARRDARALISVPVIAVGEASAVAAREAGFARVESAAGDVAALADRAAKRFAPGGGPLLHVAGTAVAGDLKGDLERRGFSVTRIALYEAKPATALPEAAAAALKAGAVGGAFFHSPRTAGIFATLVRKAQAEASLAGVTAYCLSQAVANELAGLPFAAIRVSGTPDQPALLALLSD
jgi:uroporphyrinogen-III synthase